MSLQGFLLTQVLRAPHLADGPLLEALQLVLPEQAIDAAIATAGAQEQRRRLLPARLVVALVIAMGLWARDGLRDVQHLAMSWPTWLKACASGIRPSGGTGTCQRSRP